MHSSSKFFECFGGLLKEEKQINQIHTRNCSNAYLVPQVRCIVPMHLHLANGGRKKSLTLQEIEYYF